MNICYHTIIKDKNSNRVRHYFGKHIVKRKNDNYIGSGKIITAIKAKQKREDCYEIECIRSKPLDSEELSFEFEELLISEGRSKYGEKFVLNLTAGGEGVSGYKHSIHTKRIISERGSGRNHYMYGKNHNVEIKKKLSEAQKKNIGEKSPRFKGWYFTPNGKFSSAGEAAFHNNCSHVSILNWCNNKKPGYEFVPKQNHK